MVTGGKNFTVYVLRCFLFCKAFNCGGQLLRPELCVCVSVCPCLAADDDVCLFKISGGHRWITLVILRWENTGQLILGEAECGL